MIPTSLALLLPEFPPQRRAAAVGLWTAGAAVAATIGPTIGGLLVTASWRWVFLINLPLGGLTALAGARILRESRDPARGRRPDLAGALLLCLGVGALALGIVKGEDWGWASPATVGVEALAAASLAAVALRSLRHPAPVVEPALLRPRATRAADAGVFLFSMAFFPLLLASVLFMTEVWGYSALEAGLAIAPGPLVVALLSWPAGALAGRVGARRLVLPGVALFAAACAWWIAAAGTTHMARQTGGVVGIAAFVAILGAGAPDLAGFRAGWAMMALAALAAGAVATLLPAPGRTAPAERGYAGTSSAAAP
jgi:MFS family permease